MSFGRLQDNFAAIIAVSFSALKTAAHWSLLYIRPGKMITICDLPVEVLANILTFLPPKDHAAMSQVCHLFNDASKIEFIWNKRCRQEYKVDVIRNDFSSKDIYTKLLYKYGTILGLWQPEMSSYGGLLQVEFENGKLVGSELAPPLDSNITLPLCKTLRFVLSLTQDGAVKAHCVGIKGNYHLGDISLLGKNVFAFKCQDTDLHVGKHKCLLEQLNEEPSVSSPELVPQTREYMFMKYLVMRRYNFSYKYNRVFMPKKTTNVPIQPGLFKGTYGSHGLELIMLDYDEDNTIAKAVKVSGDPNVPAGKITFMAELNYNIQFSLLEQASISLLENAISTSIKYSEEKIDLQPFKVPTECLERYHEVPNVCKGRFCATGQIAGHGFINPSFTNGHWIVFDEDLFGFLWFELLSLSMYHRVKEDLIQ